MEQAQAYLDRAKALNAKHEAARQQMRDALNKAVVVIGMLGLFGVAFVWSMNEADRQFSIQDKINQEASVNVYRR